jgi:hypothetical protein
MFSDIFNWAVAGIGLAKPVHIEAFESGLERAGSGAKYQLLLVPVCPQTLLARGTVVEKLAVPSKIQKTQHTLILFC